MAELEEWVAFFEEKGCGKLAEVASESSGGSP